MQLTIPESFHYRISYSFGTRSFGFNKLLEIILKYLQTVVVRVINLHHLNSNLAFELINNGIHGLK